MTTAKGNGKQATARAEMWTRHALKQTQPDRRAAGFYRTAESGGATLGGIPLSNVNDAVVAAVRMGYEVAAAQIDRSNRLAKRLREAGDRAVGPDSARKSLDAAESLVFRTMMGALTWLESAAGEPESPLMRLAAAEYRLLGSLLGLTAGDAPQRTSKSSEEPTPDRAEPSDAGAAARAAQLKPRQSFLQIRHQGKSRRAVRVVQWEFEGAAELPASFEVTFYSVEHIEAKGVAGTLVVSGQGAPMLSITTPAGAPSGLWRGAICNPSGLQLGYIEFTL